MDKREDILKAIRQMKAMPPIAVEIVHLLQDPDYDFNKLIQMAEHDPGLTADLLRVANCAFFSTARRIQSVRQAVMRLGVKWVYEAIVLNSVVGPLSHQPIPGYNLPANALLNHSIAVAVGTEEIGRTLAMQMNDDYIFTAGLLHDLGKVAMSTFVAADQDSFMRLVQEEHVPFVEAEQEILGITHAEAGAALLEHWKLPVSIVNTVRWHHYPDQYSSDNSPVDLVHLADHLSAECGLGLQGATSSSISFDNIVSRIEISPEQIKTILRNIMIKVAQWQNIMGIVETAKEEASKVAQVGV